MKHAEFNEYLHKDRSNCAFFSSLFALLIFLVLCSVQTCFSENSTPTDKFQGNEETILVSSTKTATQNNIRIFISPTDHLAIGECFFVRPDSTYLQNWYNQSNSNKCVFRFSFTVGGDSESIPTLYPVLFNEYAKARKVYRVLFRSPKEHWLSFRKTAETKRNPFIRPRLDFPGNETAIPIESGQPEIFDQKSEEFEKLLAEWRAVFLDSLKDAIKTHEDHEAEILLYLRWAGELPNENFQSWAREDLWRWVWSLTGVNDIRDALPSNSADDLQCPRVMTASMPVPIELPKVAVPQQKLSSGTSSLAMFVPRSCYYMEWPTWGDFVKSLQFLTDQMEKWSPGFYPRPTAAIFKSYLDEIGITSNYIKTNLSSDTGPIVLAGWDPFFAAGTGILLIVQGKTANLPAPIDKKFTQKIDNRNILLLANSERLFKMAMDAPKNEKNLINEAGFRYSRQRLSTPTGMDKEHFFMYLSDYWLTNLISPRWIIQNSRLNVADARIRLTELLKIIWMQEYGRSTSPSLNELRANSPLPIKWTNWLLEDLDEDPVAIKSKTLGGLYKHVPIDQLPFERISQEESSLYERFKSDYSRRWRQMDPIALQIIEKNDSTKWVIRLYVSPIGNQSDFRMLRNHVSTIKPYHRFEPLRGQAYGLSLAVQSKIFGSLPLPLNLPNLPVVIFAHIWGFDGAPTSFTAEHWLDTLWTEDTISKARIPIAVSIPTPLAGFLLGFLQDFRREPSDFQGIEKLVSNRSVELMIIPPLLTFQAENGYGTFSLDASTLIRLMASGTEALLPKDSIASDTEVGADIHAFLDFTTGPMLKRRFLQAAVQNRGIESWRRLNRLRRITHYFDLDMIDNSGYPNEPIKGEWLKNIKSKHIFPSQIVTDDSTVSKMPAEIGQKSEHSWGWNDLSGIARLPEILLLLKRLDFFINIEDNGLFFETHLNFEKGPKSDSDSPSSATPNTPATQQRPAGNTSLDFDNP